MRRTLTVCAALGFAYACFGASAAQDQNFGKTLTGTVAYDGSRATIETARGSRYTFRRQANGIWGITLLTPELVAEALGEHVFDFFLRNKRAEWESYRRNVTPFELKTYLSL